MNKYAESLTRIMNSKELLEVHDLLQQQAAVIEQQRIVISKLLQIVGQNKIAEEFIN